MKLDLRSLVQQEMENGLKGLRKQLKDLPAEIASVNKRLRRWKKEEVSSRNAQYKITLYSSWTDHGEKDLNGFLFQGTLPQAIEAAETEFGRINNRRGNLQAKYDVAVVIPDWREIPIDKKYWQHLTLEAKEAKTEKLKKK